MSSSLSLRQKIALIFAALAAGTIIALIIGLVLARRHFGDLAVTPALLLDGMIAGFLCLGLIAGVWFQLDRTVARPVDALAGFVRARAHSDVVAPLTDEKGLGDLTAATAAIARTLSETRTELATVIARATAALATEKARLEALLSDVPVGVLLCSGDHMIAFYNGMAVSLLTGGKAAGLGLDRTLFDYLHPGPIRHARERLMAAREAGRVSDLICSTTFGAQVLAAKMRLLPGEASAPPGYVLTLRDVTTDLAAHARREALLTEMLDRVRRPAANLHTVLDVLPPGEVAPARLDAAMRAEAQALIDAISELSTRHEAGRADAWPLMQTRGSDLVDGLRARMEVSGLNVEAEGSPLLLRCNGFEVIALMAKAATEIAARGFAKDFRLSIAEEGTNAMLRLEWQGAPLPVSVLEGWLAEPMDAAVPDVTGRNVLRTHATEIWPESGASPDRQALSLALPVAQRAETQSETMSRTAVYDFDLLSKDHTAPFLATPLQALTYVVFDTETTGLAPDRDEIVQIAAVRIVNGRKVAGEVFDALVNPGRAIPASSTKIHGITDAMVSDAPQIAEVGRAFHRFAAGSVLIAHNAPFDMAFLHRAEPLIGAVFDMPVLDTVLLSAVLFGQHEVHTLDALTQRLGITIPEEARHTALGDTVATAEAFLKLLPMLRGSGLTTFGEVLAEVRKHGRLLRDLN